MATLQTYQVIGMAEDVSSTIANISPTSTPFQAAIKTEKVHARTFEWMEDSIRAAGVNALVEGSDSSDTSVTQPTMRSNTTQIIGESFKIAGTVDAIKTHARAKETAYALAKTLKAIKLDVERAMVGVSQAAVVGSASAARKMASADQMITTTLDAGSNSTDALTESKLLQLHQTCYEAGSDPSILMVKPADAGIISGFTTASSRTRDFGQSKTLTAAVEVLVTSFGTLRVLINRNQLGTLAYLLDPSMWKQCQLRPFTRTLLAKTSDSDNHFVVGETSLKHSSFASCGVITGLS